MRRIARPRRWPRRPRHRPRRSTTRFRSAQSGAGPRCGSRRPTMRHRPRQCSCWARPPRSGRRSAPTWTECLGRAQDIASNGNRVLLLARGPDGCRLRDERRPGLPAWPPGAGRPPVLRRRASPRRSRDARRGSRRPGVDLKVVSGDDPSTVEAIARQVGLSGSRARRRPASNLARLDDAALADAVGRATVFGRIEPSLKARLVAALRTRGRYVAMIGDGVNDLLPLRRANLGHRHGERQRGDARSGRPRPARGHASRSCRRRSSKASGSSRRWRRRSSSCWHGRSTSC